MMDPRDRSQMFRFGTFALTGAAVLLTLSLGWRVLFSEAAAPIAPATAPPVIDAPPSDEAQSPAVQNVNAPGRPGGSKPTSAMEEAAKRVTQRNIWVPPQTKSFQLIGVLGNMALFQGQQPVGVGGTVDGAKVLAIGADWAEIEYESKKQRLQVFNQNVPGGSPSGGSASRGPGGPGGSGGRFGARGDSDAPPRPRPSR